MLCRVLDLHQSDALFNVAFERFLLEESREDKLVLAFTNWRPSVLIGSSQSLLLDVNIEECKKRGITVMRRFSGGQAVYLDDTYIVFCLVGPRNRFPAKLDSLRQQLCLVTLNVLKKIGVPAQFFPPDNLVVNIPKVRTLGNSGQVLKKDVILLQTSIRYELREESLRNMLAVLKTNGNSLTPFFDSVKNSLASVKEFSTVSVAEIKRYLVEEITRFYSCETHSVESLSQLESRKVKEFVKRLIAEDRLNDKPGYQSRGVCYFYLNGKCIVPEVAAFLPSTTPSTYFDSTIS